MNAFLNLLTVSRIETRVRQKYLAVKRILEYNLLKNHMKIKYEKSNITILNEDRVDITNFFFCLRVQYTLTISDSLFKILIFVFFKNKNAKIFLVFFWKTTSRFCFSKDSQQKSMILRSIFI